MLKYWFNPAEQDSECPGDFLQSVVKDFEQGFFFCKLATVDDFEK